MKKPTVTRFAPSPTGDLHLGSLRTALFNWLHARANRGQFILRIEDTDRNRLVEGAAERIAAQLRSLGLDWDFGPGKPHPEFGSAIQSERKPVYQQAIQELLDKKIAYYDYTSPEELAELRRQAQAERRAFVFRKDMARLTGKPGEPASIRISLPDDLEIRWTDIVKGELSWQSKDIGDFVAMKSDGLPTYHFANVVDDHEMAISEVIRSDEWLSSTPKHLYLFDCFGWPRPHYAHAPGVLAPAGNKKLSKRDGDQDILSYLNDGYLPEALLNYLSLLGWNPKTDQEFFTPEELIESFKIENIQVSPARFDRQRLDWFNGRHIRALKPQDRLASAEKYWPRAAGQYDELYREKVLNLVYERLKKWSDLAEASDFFFEKPKPVPMADLTKVTKLHPAQVNSLISQTVAVLEDESLGADQLEDRFYQIAQNNQVKTSPYFSLIRCKLSGKTVTPGLFDVIQALGRQEAVARLQAQP